MKDEDKEHPEDKAMRLAAIERTRKNAPAFIKKHQAMINSLLTVFEDESARRMLADLRNELWSMD